MTTTEETASATIKAWRENSKAIRAKLEGERTRLLGKLTEIDEALAEMGVTIKPRSNGASTGHGTPSRRGNGGDIPSIRTAILTAVNGAPGIDNDGLSIAVRKLRPGVRTLRDSVIKIARGSVTAGELRAEGERGSFTYHPAKTS